MTLMHDLHPHLDGAFDLNQILEYPVPRKWSPKPEETLLLYVARNDGKVVTGRDQHGNWWKVRITAVLKKYDMLAGQLLFLTEREPKQSLKGYTYRMTECVVINPEEL